MKKRIISFLCTLALVLSLAPTAFASVDSQTKVPAGYTPIYTRADLVNVKNNLSGKYILMNDIGLGGTYYGAWTPIGTSGKAFTGVFDGNNHVVRGLYINTTASYQGLFGFNCGVIKNLTVQGSVSGGEYVGGVCGASYKNSNATDSVELSGLRNECKVTGTGNYVGGICGCAKVVTESGTVESNVTNCTNSGAIKGYSKYVGGICGANIAYVSSTTAKSASAVANITNCANVGEISGKMVIGGVCGTNQAQTVRSNSKAKAYAKISLCSNTGSVTASDSACGGVCAVNDATTYNIAEATVDSCYNSGMVASTGVDAGGVVSRNQSESMTTAAVAKCTVSNVYNLGTVRASKYIGGLVAYNCANSEYGTCYATVTKGYSAGTLSSADSVGGAVGYTYTGANVTYASGLSKVSKTVCNGCYYLSGTASKGIGHGEGTVSALSSSDLKAAYTSLGSAVWKKGSGYPEINGVRETNTYPAISGNITIEGELRIGRSLTLNVKDIAPSGVTYSVKWYRDGKEIGTGSSHVMSEDDYGHEIYCVLYASGRFNGSLRSASVKPEKIKLDGELLFSCPVEYDRTVGALLPYGNVSANYEWKIDGKSVSREKTYYIDKDAIGKTLTLTVTGYGDYAGTMTGSAVVEKRTVDGKISVKFENTKYGNTVEMDISAVKGLEENGYKYDLVWLCDGEFYKGGSTLIMPESRVGQDFLPMFVIRDEDELYRGSIAGDAITCSSWSNPFVDVKTGTWYEPSVRYTYESGLFSGVTQHTFEPDEKMTRAMFVVVLSRLYGAKTDNNVQSEFSDVKSGSWYTGAVVWASNAGITSGTSKTAFSPDEPITREQMCTMLIRYAAYANMPLVSDTSAEPFADEGDVSSYAKDAVKLMHDCGLISGKTKTKFMPKDDATRAEVSSILSRWCAYNNE